MKATVNALGPAGLGTYHFNDGAWEQTAATSDRWLVPGFVDIHCHGAFGTDFMSASTSEIARLADRLEDCGYEAFLPTTVTASAGDVLAAFGRTPEHRTIAGFHLEGPFISPVFPGAQPPSAITPVPVPGSEWDLVLDDPRLRVVTLAPELPGALRLIERLATRGVIVSMGHTNATYAEARLGKEAGARHITHTYNAMRPLHHREAGTVGFALSDAGTTCELIYDRLHVCPEAAGILWKAKGPEGVIAVSDSTMATGLPVGTELEMWGVRSVLGKGGVHLAGKDTLAGSAITLLDAFRNLFRDFGPECAIRATSLNPRRALSLGAPKRYLLLDSALEIVDAWQAA